MILYEQHSPDGFDHC